MRSRIKAWLELFRLPNLLTVPGDPLAGFLLSAAAFDSTAVAVMAASLLFYGGGLLLNDWADQEEDRRERPERPLPSGRVPPTQALSAGVVLIVHGLLLCLITHRAVAVIGLLLVLLIISYNVYLKRAPLIGAAAMGGCRGLSLLLGAAAASEPLAWPAGTAALVLLIYIAAVTHLARRETRPVRIGSILFTPAHIGRLLGFLIPLQAAFILIAGHPLLAACWLLGWPLHHVLKKRFAPS
jgi:4-hydroxybenzoate polyprenyltransferase